MRKVAELVVERLYDSIRVVWPDAPGLTSGQIDALRSHFALLRKWNPRINLVGPSTIETAFLKHYAESLFLASRVPDGIDSILDAGSGAGFPGYPLAVLRPDVRVTLLESDRRKAAFLRESCNLANLTVFCSRLELVDTPVDGLITRAVDPRFVMAWGVQHAGSFGFIGSSEDCRVLSLDPVLSRVESASLPWQEKSSVLWARFHVEHP